MKEKEILSREGQMSASACAGRWPVAILLVLGLVSGGCGPEPATGPEAGAPVLARGGSGTVTVSAADPDTVPIDTTLTVRILGSGFTPGSKVQYAISGAVSGKVTAPVVTYVSATELSTTTVVASDAPLADYDIIVTVAGGKRGIGAEKFLVVAKPLLLPEAGGVRSYAYGVNDSHVIVGSVADAADRFTAVRWTPTGGQWSAEALGDGDARAINAGGDIVRQWYDGTSSHYWIRPANGPEFALSPGSWVNPGQMISDDGTVIGGVAGGGPVVWQRTGPATWSAAIPLPVLSGYGPAMANAISHDGHWIAGEVHEPPGLHAVTMEYAIAWKKVGDAWTGPFLVDATPGAVLAVDNGGALAGATWPCTDGSCSSQAAAWPGVGGARTLLATVGFAYVNGMNDQGIIAGRARIYVGGKRGAYYSRPVLWPTPTSQPVDLGTGVNGTKGGECMAVNGTKLAVGNISSASGTHAMAWLLP